MNVNVFAIEGKAKEYKRIKGRMFQPVVEYKKEDEKLLGTTPLAAELVFKYNAGEELHVWHPPLYIITYRAPSSDVQFKETNFVAGPFTVTIKNASGEQKEYLYSKEFPLDYFIKNKSKSEAEIPFYFIVGEPAEKPAEKK